MIEDFLQVNSASISDRGLSEKRPENEDSYLELRDSGFFAVADGVGGAQAGDVASQMAMEILGEGFINLAEGGDAEDRMRVAIEQANSAIFQMSQDLPQLSTMATTVVGLHIRNNVATIGHVGDSRLYRIDPEGHIYRETHDHSVVEEEVRAGRLTPDQAATHPNRNVISRALGADETVEIDMKTITFEPGTTFLLCSDGVTRHIADNELEQLLFAENDTFAICQYIKEICYERGAEDNLTAVVVKIAEASSDGFNDSRDEPEEQTIASIRLPDKVNNFKPSPDAQMADTLDMDEDVTDEDDPAQPVQTFEEQIPIEGEAPAEDTISFVPAPEKEDIERAPKARSDKKKDEKTFRVDEGKSSPVGGFMTILPWVLLVGLLLFSVFYYFATNSQTDNINALKPEPPNYDQQTFEDNRRSVDSNPAEFVAAISNIAKDAEDFYLLGRAYFLQKNYQSAKVNLERAKSLMAGQVSAVNKTVLEHEIPILLAIINTEKAAETYEREAGSVYQEENTNSANTQTNP